MAIWPGLMSVITINPEEVANQMVNATVSRYVFEVVVSHGLSGDHLIDFFDGETVSGKNGQDIGPVVEEGVVVHTLSIGFLGLDFRTFLGNQASRNQGADSVGCSLETVASVRLAGVEVLGSLLGGEANLDNFGAVSCGLVSVGG